MDAMFVNQLTLTKEVLHEFYKGFSALPHGLYRIIKIALPVVGVFLILLAFLQAFEGDISGCIVGFIIGLFGIFFFPFFLRILSKLRYRQQTLMNGGNEVQEKIEFSEQINITSSTKSEVHFDYSQIRQICETKNLIILRSAYAVGMVVGKNNFTIGTLEDFRKFIKGKCPSAHYFSCK